MEVSTVQEKGGQSTFSKETREGIRSLQTRNNTTNLFFIAFDWAVIIGAIALSQMVGGMITYLIAVFLIASRQRAFDNLTHEASHNSLFKNKTMNNWLGMLFASFPIFTSLSAYRVSHFTHHKHLSEENDPDLIRYKLFGLENPPQKKWVFILKHMIKPLTLIHVPRYIYGTLSSFIFSKEIPLKEQLGRLAYWAVVITAAVLTGHGLDLVLYWVVPYVTVLQVIRYYAEMSEHAGIMEEPDPLFKTRNVFGNILFLKLFYPHKDHFHLIHHLYAGIPHYNMHAAHQILMQEPEYCKAKHCIGYFSSPYQGVNCVLDDIRLRGIRKHVFSVNNVNGMTKAF